MKPRILIVAFALVAFAALLAGAHRAGALTLSPMLLVGSRWIAIAALAAYALARRTLTVWILFAMAVGAEIGVDAPAFAVHLKLLSDIFLRLIKVIIATLLFATLVAGIAGHADIKSVGRMGVRALVYFEVISTLALLVGFAAINLSRAGLGVELPAQDAAANARQLAVTQASPAEFILRVFPENIAKSVAENEVLEVVVFSILFGIALAMVGEAKRRAMLALAESLAEVMFKFTNIVMLYAPVAAGAAIGYTVGATGLGVVGHLLKLLGTLYGALAAFILLILLPVALLARVPLRRFLRAVAEPVSIAFATASSEAALPRAMEEMEAMGVPRAVVAFVMPTGYSFNLDGSALYLSLASVFVAQVAGMHLSLSRQLVMVFTLMLTSKGVAGVARASIVVLLATAGSLGLPAAPILILLGVDQLMDMARTSVNVLGNCLATAVIARWEEKTVHRIR